MESSMEIPQKIINGSGVWPSNPISGNISEGTQNTNLKEHKHSYVHCSIICIHQDIETAQVSTNRGVDKATMGHLHNAILLGHKNWENFTLCDSMDGPGEHYAMTGMSNSFPPGGHISLMVAFKGLNVILGLYKCNC